MKGPAKALLPLLLLAAPCAAHEYPIAPVKIVLRAEPSRVVADVDSDSIYWIEEIVNLHPMPIRDWPAEALAKTEKYVNDHLRLSIDGRPLTGRLIAASYIQRPWEVNEQGRFRLRLEYPPLADGRTLSGEADFFEEYRRERLEGKQPILPFMDFRALLSVAGRRTKRFELRPGNVFRLPAAEARRGPVPRFFDSMGVGAAALANLIEGWAALAALALSLGPGALLRRRTAGPLAGILLGMAAASAAAAPWVPWAAGLAAAAAAGRWAGEASAPWLESAAAAALGGAWMRAAAPFFPRTASGVLERTAAAAGIEMSAAAALAGGILLVNAMRRGFDAVSEAHAPRLFERRRRLAATALVLICGYGLSSTLGK